MEASMSFALLSSVGLILILKTLHVAAGTVWVGFSLAELIGSESPRNSKIIFVSATVTLVTGLLHIIGNYSLSFYSSWGISMLLGSALGFIMWLNLVAGIMPAHKSGHHDRARALVYANFLFAVPMLFFMEAASHLGIEVNAESNRWALILSLALPLVFSELYVLTGKGPQIRNLKGALAAGVLLNLILYVGFEVMAK